MEQNNDMEWLDELTQRKAYHQLSPAEKERVLKVIGSEEQYNILRKVSQALVADKADLSPDPDIIENLKGRLARRHRKNAFQRVIGFRVPAYAAVAMIVMAVLSSFYLAKDEIPPVEAVTRVERDTVYIVEKPDTVVVEKVIYRDKVLPSRENYHVVKSVIQEEENGSGVSMKEKEELENLLVSGS
jgi:hypothetical protein